MDLSLVMNASSADELVGPVEKGNAGAAPGKYERSATPQEAPTKHSHTPIYSGLSHANFNS
jgi:hypothetical protein